MRTVIGLADALKQRPIILIFTFLASIYVLTMGVNRGGFGYSPDGTFSFEMAKSLVVDGKHRYLRDNYGNFSRWGPAMAVMLAPFVRFADPLSDLAPQRDRLEVDGYEYLLSHFRSIGHASIPDARPSMEFGVPDGAYSEFTIISHLGLSQEIPQRAEVASIRITDASGVVHTLPIRAGIESAEWAYERADVLRTIKHDRARFVGTHIGNARANYYFARYTFDRPLNVRSGEIVYTGPPGKFFLDSAGFRDAVTGEIVEVPGRGRVWSERQNKEFFLRFWSPVLSVLLMAGAAVFVFKIVEILGYGRGVATALSLTFGLATMAWPYAKFDFSEPGVTFFLAGAALASLHFGRDLRLRYAAIAGLLVLGAVLTKYVAVIAFPGLALQLILSHSRSGVRWTQLPLHSGRTLLAFVAPSAVIVVPALLLLAVVLDFRLLYEKELWGGIQRGWFAVPIALGMKGLLVSWGKGIFLYNPILLLSIPAGIWFVHRHGWKSVVFLAIPIAYLLLYSKKEVWYGGNCWGPRYLVPTLPFLLCLSAPAFEWIGAHRRRLLTVALAGLVSVSVIPQLLGVSKDFDQYLGLYADQIVWQLPENGGIYGGSEYQRWSSIQPEGDLAAVLFAPQFTPLLGHLWLLRADVTELILPDRLDLLEDALGRTPWLRFGIDAPPERPQDATGLDFWSMTMWANYLNHKYLVGIVMAALVGVELVALVALGLLFRTPAVTNSVPRRLRISGLAMLAIGFVAFDTLHFML